MASKITRFIIFILIIGIGFFIVIQFIPYGHDHNNPPIVKGPNWSDPKVKEIAKKSCFDCHSNETFWPWYSNIAPVSWLVYSDVQEGRSIMNFSDWQGMEADEIGEVIDNNIMPPAKYLLMHPNAKLSAEEKQILIQGMVDTLK